MTVPLKAVRRPPGPDQPVALNVDAETLSALRRLQAAYGNIVGVTTPRGRSAYFVNEPDAIRGILVKNHSKYIKGPGFERVKMLLGNGLFVSDGSTWRRSRTMVQPGFTRQSLHRMIPLMVRCCEEKAACWTDSASAGDTVNITTEMTDFALEVILRAIFGSDYDRRIVTGGDNPFAFLSQESARDLQLVMKLRALRELVLKVVDERRRSPETGEYDFLSVYLSAEDKAGEKYSDDELLDELMTLIVAGFETSAGTLNWAWHLIAGHAQVEQKILAELEDVVPEAAAIDDQTLANLTYLRNVLDETLRLYPPGWLFSRRATEADTVGDYDVPAGTDIYISPYILHRTEEYWSQPDAFNPDRFTSSEPDSKPSKRQAAFIPFSLGPRRCIGEYFAILEMKVHFAVLLPQFHLSRTSDAQPDLDLGINLRTKQDITLRPKLRALD